MEKTTKWFSLMLLVPTIAAILTIYSVFTKDPSLDPWIYTEIGSIVFVGFCVLCIVASLGTIIWIWLKVKTI